VPEKPKVVQMALNVKEMTLKRTGFAVGLTVLLSGCGVYDDVKFSMARDALRQECMGNFTNSCVSKTIDYNVMLLEHTKAAWLDKESELSAALGSDGGKLWTKLVEERTEQLVDKLESARPGFFSRWFLGDAQPFDGKGMMELSEQDLHGIQTALMAEFVTLGKKQGLTATVNTAKTSAPQLQVTQAPEPVAAAPAEAQSDDALNLAINDVITAEVTKEGGTEYTENRQVIYVDLNGDDQPDAVVLFTIEGQGGGNGSYQSLAGFYRSGAGWAYQGHSAVFGAATDIKPAGPQLVAVTSLTSGPDDPRCCPSVEAVDRYQWNGRGFEVKKG
jgi:hypothetical protein